MMSLRNTIIASLLFHASFMAIFFKVFPARAVPEQLETVQWMIDLGSDLRSIRTGDSKRIAEPSSEPKSEPPVPGQTTQNASLPIPSTPPDVKAAAAGNPGLLHENPAVAAAGSLKAAFANTMSQQALMGQVRQFFRLSNISVRGIVQNSLSPSEIKALTGSRGTVTIGYRDSEIIDFLVVEADNETLRLVLMQKVPWGQLPPPKHYLLPYRKVSYSITLSDDKISVVVSPT